MGRTIRCFIALPLPDPVQAACAAAIAQLERAGLPVRRTAPASIHLTLKFLGDVPRGDLPALEDALGAATAAHGPFDLATGRLGMFGKRGRPRVLWLGVEGDRAALGALHASVEAACAEAGFPREARAFHPHLTVGRVKGPAAPAPAGWPEEEAPPAAVPWPVQTVHLYASHLRPAGAEHETLAICSLVTD